MNRLKLGVRLESFGLPFRRALEAAARLGVQGVAIDAVEELAPQQLSQTGRRELGRLLRTHNLALSALGCPLRRGLDTTENQQPRIEHVLRAMTLSCDLGANVVIVQAGQVPEKEDDPRTAPLVESMRALSQFGDRTGARLALETGLESGELLHRFLTRFDSGALGVNLSPANLVVHGFDLYESVRQLHEKILHAHAGDARRASPNRAAQEVPLGHGDIDWLQLLSVFEEVNYHGWLTVAPGYQVQGASEITAAVAFLKRLVGG